MPSANSYKISIVWSSLYIYFLHNINIIIFYSAINDISNFLLELGGFLKDYGCPYRTLLNSENRLNNRTSRLQLLGEL